ncbi:MAG: cation diffusion facilitator family transporter [Polyangiaceae bacterium]
MSHGGGGDPRKVVIAALAGNAAIATAKFVAAWLSGSVTMLAEGVHSLADTANQGLLLVGMRLAAKKDPIRFPMGRAKEIYFWAFIVSLLLFFLGGVFAISEGVEKLRHPSHESHGVPIAPLVVLVVSIAAEGGSFMVAFKEFNKSRKGQTFFRALFGGKDPTIPLVLLEDTGAIVGLVVALVAVALSWLTGSSAVDSIGSIIIGVLLCAIGVLLAKDTHALLLGEGITEEVRQEIIRVGRAIDGVLDVTQVLSLHLGPDNVLVALKVRFPQDMIVADVERITNTLEEKLRAAHPELKRIFVEADSVYDPTKDTEYL